MSDITISRTLGWGWDEPLLRRALQSYFRAASWADQPSESLSTLEDCAGETYAVLRNTSHTLAVYRLSARGILRRTMSYPAVLDEEI